MTDDLIERAAVKDILHKHFGEVKYHTTPLVEIRAAIDALPSVTAGVKVDAAVLIVARHMTQSKHYEEGYGPEPVMLARELIRIAETGQIAATGKVRCWQCSNGNFHVFPPTGPGTFFRFNFNDVSGFRTEVSVYRTIPEIELHEDNNFREVTPASARKSIPASWHKGIEVFDRILAASSPEIPDNSQQDAGPVKPKQTCSKQYDPDCEHCQAADARRAAGPCSQPVAPVADGGEPKSLRDEFAMAAMAAIISIPTDTTESWSRDTTDEVASQAYVFADAMLAARVRKAVGT